ncbi:hypothetical protein FA95DRAFT_1561931 [Auriscalpium vulgare]|uniref:Uncharacterized protein n=1 Tax=Auriscalpium vulgare TaxID=40419 RepID=A0ACB8RLR7_9AGAM|nr:hypothetical protein FA95DRAFT_1561931 [Auriscalpium vulgare]
MLARVFHGVTSGGLVAGSRLSLAYMSTATPARPRGRPKSPPAPRPKHKFIVYAPDSADEGTFERRLSVRPRHMEGVKKLLGTGHLLFGGAMLIPESVDSKPTEMVGSVLFYEAESLEEVQKTVESDIYYTSGVWDPKRIVIAPFAPAMPWPAN